MFFSSTELSWSKYYGSCLMSGWPLQKYSLSKTCFSFSRSFFIKVSSLKTDKLEESVETSYAK